MAKPDENAPPLFLQEELKSSVGEWGAVDAVVQHGAEVAQQLFDTPKGVAAIASPEQLSLTLPKICPPVRRVPPFIEEIIRGLHEKAPNASLPSTLRQRVDQARAQREKN